MFADAIKQFSDGPVEEIDENNQNLKCYMYCLYHTFEHYEESHDFDELDFFTPEEVDTLLDMGDKCESYEYNEQKNEKCEYAFQLSKCWKMANPEVNLKSGRKPRLLHDFLSFSTYFQYYFLL